MIKNYDPNYGFGEHKVEVIFRKWDYQKSKVVRVSGNCKGLEIFNTAADQACEDIFKSGMTMLRKDGEVLTVDPGEYDVNRAIVSVTILSFEATKK